MPIFNYFCENCNHKQEHILKYEDNIVCPKCGSKGYVRQLAAPAGFILKGSGFFRNDYKAPCGVDKDKVPGCSGGCGCD